MPRIIKSSLLALSVFLLLAALITVNADWSDETRLTTHTALDFLPSIAQIDNGDIWLVWQTKRATTLDLYYKIYNGTWTRDKRLFFVFADTWDDTAPYIMQTRNGTIWVFWAIDTHGDYDIVYRRSNDYGLNWTPNIYVTDSSQVPTDAYDDKVPAALESSDGSIWVVWQRTVSPGNDEIFYKINNGTSWSDEVQLTSSSGFDKNPSIVQAKNGSISIFWSAYKGETNYEIVYRVYNGMSWGPEQQLTQTPIRLDSDPSAILARNGTIWVVWPSLEVNNSTALYELFYKISEDNGNTWSPTDQLTYDPSWQDKWPSITQGKDKKIWVAWTSSRNDNYDIYYKTSDPITYHDVAVTNITLSQTPIYQGENVFVTVEVENKGDFTETFTVECYANSTLLGSETITLAPQDSTTLVWNMSGFAPGIYTISATASAVPEEDVINMDDNTLTDGTVRVKIVGDVNGDGTVGADDLVRVNEAYGAVQGSPNWDEEADMNRDGIVDAYDLAVVGKHYGETV